MMRYQNILKKPSGAGPKMVFAVKMIFFILCLFFTGTQICSAQTTGDYESNGTGGGTWNVAATWLIYNGSMYTAAAIAPSNSSNNIIVQAGDAVGVTSVESLGANITVNGSLTITGTLSPGTNNILGTGSFILSGGATLNIGSLLGITSAGATGNVQTTTRNFNTAANYNYVGAAAQVSGNGLPAGITGTLTDNNTNTASGLTLSQSVTVTSPGSFVVPASGVLTCTALTNILGTGSFTLNSGAAFFIGSAAGISTTAATGNVQVTGVKTFNAAASYTYFGTIIQATGNALPSPLTGSLTSTNTNGSGCLLTNSLIVTSPGTVTVTGAMALNAAIIISGTGTFTLSSGGTLLTANAAGISATGASGSIQTSVINFNAGGNYLYFGSVAQITGSGLPASAGSLNINNSSVAGVSLTNSVTVGGLLTLSNGIFCLNGNTLTIPAGKTISVQSGSLSLCAGNIVFTSNVNLTYSGPAAVTTGAEIPVSATALTNFSITGSGKVVTLGSNATVNGTLTMTAGSFLPGSFALNYAAGAQLVYNGTAAQTTGPEWPSAAFARNVTINNSFSSSGLSLDASRTNYTGTITVGGTGFFNSGNFTLGGTGNIAVNAGATFITPNSNGVSPTGAIQLTGTRTFAAGSSYVFNGTAAQITGTEMPASVANMTINNPAGLQLNNTVTIGTSLSMTQGNLDLNTKTVTLGTTALLPGALNYTAGAMINTGSFTRWFATSTIAAGGVAGLFPLGTITDNRPFSISIPAAPTTGGTITASYTNAATNTTTSFTDGVAVVAVRKDLNWGVATAGLVGGSYNLGISGTGYGLVGNVSDLRLTLVNSVVGTAGVNAGTTSNPQVNRTGLTQANLNNTFYLGSINSVNTPLPITLLSFTATVQNAEVALNWSTAREINNDYFTIQRSKDASAWEDLERVAGSGTSNSVSSYAGYDPAPYQGVSYYRLIQTDLDGKQTISSIKTVSFVLSSAISVYPNPASNLVTINFARTGKYHVSLVNSGGEMVNSFELTGNTLGFYVSSLPDGVYFIHIDQTSNSEIIKIVIKK